MRRSERGDIKGCARVVLDESVMSRDGEGAGRTRDGGSEGAIFHRSFITRTFPHLICFCLAKVIITFSRHFTSTHNRLGLNVLGHMGLDIG